MPEKTLIFIGMTVGSVVGGYLPILWGADLISFSSVLFSGIGALIGIWLGHKISQSL